MQLTIKDDVLYVDNEYLTHLQSETLREALALGVQEIQAHLGNDLPLWVIRLGTPLLKYVQSGSLRHPYRACGEIITAAGYQWNVGYCGRPLQAHSIKLIGRV